MRCKDIMKKDVIRVHTTDTVRAAAQMMESYGIGFLPVCDEADKPIGTLTDRDIALRCVAHELPLTSSVGDVMTCDVVACSEDDDDTDAIELMSEKQKSRLMCVDKRGKLVGVISLSDLPSNLSRKKAGEVLRQVTERETKPS